MTVIPALKIFYSKMKRTNYVDDDYENESDFLSSSDVTELDIETECDICYVCEEPEEIKESKIK